jgi:endo-1,4-beta-xylanase
MESSISTAQARTILRDYIFAVAGRYAGKIAMWDVVNEAIADSQNSRPFNLRDSFWYRKLGTEFLTLAFTYAHQADPSAKLYYNDYNIERGGWKGDSAIALSNFVRANGGQVDGIGLQYHTGLSDPVSPGDAHYQYVNKIATNGYTWQITELDCGIQTQSFPSNDPHFGIIPLRQTDLTLQATVFANIVKMGMSSPACRGIQMWGITDRHSWIPNFNSSLGCATIFDANYLPKPAANSIWKLFRDAPTPAP